jgi:hypothetical protein
MDGLYEVNGKNILITITVIILVLAAIAGIVWRVT